MLVANQANDYENMGIWLSSSLTCCFLLFIFLPCRVEVWFIFRGNPLGKWNGLPVGCGFVL